MRAFDVNEGIESCGSASSNPEPIKPVDKEHQSFDGDQKMTEYPPARIPTAPVLSLASFARDTRKPMPASILDSGEARFVTSGRVAIALALQQMKIGPGDSVLVPSYHCASMIEPVIWVGAKPVFYRINADTSVNLDDVATKLDGRTKAIMATNYFGFPQNLSKIRAFCDTHGLLMLEDCAHSFFGEHNGKSIGSYGDYAIASSMKFFPIYEGGCLVSSRHPLASVALHGAGAGFEAKVAFNTLEDCFEYRRLGGLKAILLLPMMIKNFLWSQVKARKTASSRSLSPGSSDGGFGFDPSWLHKRSSYFSRMMIKLVSRRRMAALRRKNYQTLYEALSGLPGCRPLFPTLPDGVYPWVFPLYTDEPKNVFNHLKLSGVPVIRFGEYLWPGVDTAVCADSVELSRRVLQFPCHQELRKEELEWMISQIKDALISTGSAKT